MISGFNTDVKFEDVVYHIQTEDKGLRSRLIVSLVYDGGTILASKRISYDDLASTAFDENELAARVQRQHKLICAAVKAGRLDELKGMAAEDRSRTSKAKATSVPKVADIQAHILSGTSPIQVATVAEVADLPANLPVIIPEERIQPESAREAVVLDGTPVQQFEPVSEEPYVLHQHPTQHSEPVREEPVVLNEHPIQQSEPVSEGPFVLHEQPIQHPEPVPEEPVLASADTAFHIDSNLDLEVIEDHPIFEGVTVIEEEAILPPEAVAVVSELSGTERPTNTKLSVELLGDTKFKGGDRRTVNIMVCRGTDRKVIGDAQIMIKVLGSSFRPVIFHAKSDANGLAKVHLQLPHFQAGRAALLIRAMSGGEEIELRRVVTPG